MDYSDFRRQAIRSADIYLKYLQKHNRGISESKVSRIRKRNRKVYLTLVSPLSPAALDSISLQIRADRYSVEKIHPVDYQTENMLLILQPERDLYDMIPSGNCNGVSVVSSLLFLVERVGKWYQNHADPLSLPVSAPAVSLPAFFDMAGGRPSQEQYEAVCGVLSSPFSYVWGAPGTGKTRYVLSNCILTYLREDRRVLLVAPTNNALDQMLSGVLEVLDSSGIPRSCVRRMGIPSRAFLGKYPDVCERQPIEEQRSRLSKRIESLRQQLEIIRQWKFFRSLLPSLSELQTAFQAAEESYIASSVSAETIRTLQSDLDDLEQHIRALSREIDELTVWRDSFPGRLSRFFRPRFYSKKTAALEDAERMRTESQHNGENLYSRIASYQSQNVAAEEQYLREYQDLHFRLLPLVDSLCIEASSVPIAAELKRSLASESVQNILPQLDDLLVQLRAQYDALTSSVRSEDEQQLAEQLDVVESELAHIEDDTASRQDQVRVLAMTIDRCISSTMSAPQFDFVPEHVFMDEAAYCSLIKGYTLFVFNCPLTLLGDHAQLPPVCEMSDTAFKDSSQQPIFFWAQSAIYLESANLRSYQALYAQYASGNFPDFQELRCYTLSVTYRFGPSLARILADFIYTSDFHSAITEETSIRYIHAPSSPDDPPRTSSSECFAITALAKQLTADHKDFAILTPYKRQIDIVSKQAAHIFPREKVMTVHASQGREFHTVVLSVVDTSHKFFVNSSIPVGKSVLNTAISRTKSELVLILDSEYWSTQKNQLIGRLMQIASPYNGF